MSVTSSVAYSKNFNGVNLLIIQKDYRINITPQPEDLEYIVNVERKHGGSFYKNTFKKFEDAKVVGENMLMMAASI